MSMQSPDLWSKVSGCTLTEANRLLEKYSHLIKWKENESILEFGIASGKNSLMTLGKILPKDYKEFVGVDISEEMIKYAEENCKLPKSKFLVMDISADTIPEEMENRFDHIFSFYVIHMVKNPRQAFTNIHKMLKPNGTMFLIFFKHIPFDPIFDVLSKHPVWGKYNQESAISSYYYDDAEMRYKDDLIASGFNDFTFGVEDGCLVSEGEEEFNNLKITVNTILSKIPKELRDDYIKCYLEECAKSPMLHIEEKNGDKIYRDKYIGYVVGATKHK